MIEWNPSVVAFQLGPLEVRWYGLCWCIGLALAYIVVYKLYRRQAIPADKFDPLFLYCFVGILAGARLGHCLFYEPGYYLSHPIEMILPIRKDPLGSWHYIGFAGLASHGGTIGLILALWLYVKRSKLNLMRVLDNIAIATPVTACAIRLGEILTDVVENILRSRGLYAVVLPHLRVIIAIYSSLKSGYDSASYRYSFTCSS